MVTLLFGAARRGPRESNPRTSDEAEGARRGATAAVKTPARVTGAVPGPDVAAPPGEEAPMKKRIGVMMLALALPAPASDKIDVVGAWAMDADKSAAAPDGNTAGVMATVEFKADGTFAAMYGLGGTWKLRNKKLLVAWSNSFRGDEEAVLDGGFLKMPAPAMRGKFCYLKRK
jgi:hypothetical protein